MRAGFLAFVLLLMLPAEGLAEWQLKPFMGLDFGATTTFTDLDHVAGKPHLSFGVNGLLLGQVFGIEGEVSFAPGFFNAKEQQLVVGSSVTTATANLVVAFPRRWSQYTLRPYVVGGGGVMRVHRDDVISVLTVDSTLGTVDFGGGVTGFLSSRVGVSWDLRYFRSFGGDSRGFSIGNEQLSYWRAMMAVAIRARKATP
jgi:hypothetical protein